TSNDLIDFVVVGVGINANIDLTSFPEQLRSAVTSLREEVKREVRREEFLQIILGLLEQYYNMFVGGSFDSILKQWKTLNCVLGADVEVISLDETVKGRAVDVDRNGALIVRLGDGTIRRFIVGDVSLKKV
ncbi:biotin--[acetyl-CoA-carboxylase] ligase, partial [Candidatus Bathyarchaeota archaeon]|nr:biotin--[acetyl-CoA-carboxylase] ligase [Candidatus Bathyarchaeota archaeon]